MEKLSFIKPDDAHIHLRDDAFLQRTVADAARCFSRAVVMPNLNPPIITVAQALEYKNRILNALPAGVIFEPLMTLYLNDQIKAAEVAAAKAAGIIGFKLYPKGATTNSAAGVANLQALFPLLAAMEEHDIPLLVHGESIDPEVDVFDREKYFLDDMANLIRHFPKLRMVLEHITTEDAADFILSAPKNVAATITVHHLLLNRNQLFVGGIRPHYYCLPILKRAQHQQALIKAAASGNPKFFLGTDSAPHTIASKENACGCAGIYSAHAAIELYAEVFEQANSLDKLEAFASHFAADFYRLPRNQQTITLQKKTWVVPERLSFGAEELVPLRAGEEVKWSIA